MSDYYIDCVVTKWDEMYIVTVFVHGFDESHMLGHIVAMTMI